MQVTWKSKIDTKMATKMAAESMEYTEKML